MIIIKLGGSVITRKDSDCEINSLVVEKIASEVGKQDKKIILVHGTGSFGKPAAVKYQYLDGFIDNSRKNIVTRVKNDLVYLNYLIVKTLIKGGVDAVSVSPTTFMKCRKGIIRPFKSEFLQSLLDRKIVPVIYGDILLDQDEKYAVCSSDQMVYMLAKKFAAERVIFLSDVDGVYSKDPKQFKYNEIEFFEKITPQFFKKITRDTRVDNDVSGGMQKKIEYCLKISKFSPCLLLNGFNSDLLLKAIEGQFLRGTVFSNG